MKNPLSSYRWLIASIAVMVLIAFGYVFLDGKDMWGGTSRTGAELLMDEQKFDEAQKYYNSLLQSASTPDEKMTYSVRKAYISFVEWESRNQQEIFFKKWMELLGTIKEEQRKNYGEYYRVLWFWYEMTRKYPQALENYFKALDFSQGEETVIIQTLGGIAHTYMLQGNPYEALKYLKKSTDIKKDDVFINRLLFRTLGMIGQYSEAREMGEKLTGQLSNKEDLSELYYSLSNLSFLQEDPEKSVHYAQECLKLKSQYAPCHLALAKVYFYWVGKNNWSLAEIEAKKALSYDANSSSIMEFMWLLKEASGDTGKAVFIHTNNLKYFIDSDTNLFDNEKTIAKQRALIYLARLYSKKQEKNNALYCLSQLTKSPVNYQNLALLEQELTKEGTDFQFLLKNADLSDYLILWKDAQPVCENGQKDCPNLNIYKSINELVFDKKEFRKIDIGPLVKIRQIQGLCKNEKTLNASLKSMCLIFSSSHDYLASSNTKTPSASRDIKNLFK